MSPMKSSRPDVGAAGGTARQHAPQKRAPGASEWPQKEQSTRGLYNPLPMNPLETFPNRHPGRDYTIIHTCPEFTAVCPKTGQPDFGTIRVTYVPDVHCVELKSLKLYLHSFRNQGIFYEHVTNVILDDLVKALAPRSLTVEGEFNVRGGISSVVRAAYEKPPSLRTSTGGKTGGRKSTRKR